MAILINESIKVGSNITLPKLFLQYEGAYVSAKGISGTQATIDSIDQTTKKIVVNGDIEDKLIGAGQEFEVKKSTGNDGVYTIVSYSVTAGKTTIEVAEAIPDKIADGVIEYTKVQYFIEFTVFGWETPEYAAKMLFKNSESVNLPNSDKITTKRIEKKYIKNITKVEVQAIMDIINPLFKSDLELETFTPAKVVIV